MKRSSAANAALIPRLEDRSMNMRPQPGEDLLDVARVLVLLQASILAATAIEALVWGIAFAGAPAVTVVLTGAAASVLLVARARLRADRHRIRRLVYVVEGVTIVSLGIDTALAMAITGAAPPVVAVLTRLVLPVFVIALLRRSAAAAATPTPATITVVEGAS
jgi:hypothetical protein